MSFAFEELSCKGFIDINHSFIELTVGSMEKK